MKRRLIAPSLLSADMGCLAEELRAVETAGAELIHIDVMDGHFVPNLAMGPGVVQGVRRYSGLPLDVHLMVSRPLDYIRIFADAGADMLSFHLEATHTPYRVLDKIHEYGLKGGIVINPGTPVAMLEGVLASVDYVLLLCVEPGFGNQSFRPLMPGKIRELAELRNISGEQFQIQVDGGINENTILSADKAGADIFVMGSAIFNHPDYGDRIKTFQKMFDPAERSSHIPG